MGPSYMNEKTNYRPLKDRTQNLFILFIALGTFLNCTAFKHFAHEGTERDAWQLPARVIHSLGIQPGDYVADLGSGSGYFTGRLAQTVGPAGKVYAVDIDEKINQYVAKRVKEEGHSNVDIILAKLDDPRLPEGSVDLIFSSNTYHHLENRTSYFLNAKKYLKPSGRVAIIDFRKEAYHHHTENQVIREEMQKAGYRLEKEFDFLTKQHFLVFLK